MRNVVFFLFLVLPVFASELPKDVEASITQTIEAEMKEGDVPGAAVAIVRNGDVVYERGFGFRSNEENLAVTPQTLFRLGSTTKMLTAFVALNAAAKGEFDLNAPVGKYIPELDPAIGKVSLRQLLSHSAGMREASPSVASKDDDALKKMVTTWKDDYLFTSPGEIFSYTGPGYWLAGAVLEAALKKPYPELMKERLFAPANMVRSTLRPLEAVTYPFSQGHEIKDGKLLVVRPMAENVAQYPAGSAFSSASELAKLAVAILNDGGGVFAPVAVKQFFTSEIKIPSSADVRYGYGLVTFEMGGVGVFEHGGVRRGYGSHIRFLPDKRGAIIVLTNKNGDTLRQSLAYITKTLWGVEEPKPEAKTLGLSPTDAEKFVGTYVHADIVTMKVKTDGKQLLITRDAKDVALKRTGETTFEDPDGAEYAFVFVNGQAKAKYLHFDLLSTVRKD